MASPVSAPPTPTAVRRAEDDAMQRAMDAYLATHPSGELTYFLPKDDDELNNALSEGRFQRVIFADWDALMEPIWKGEAKIDAWHRAGVRIDLVTPPIDDHAAWRGLLDRTYESLTAWRRQQARRQTIAAVVLSALALAALAILFNLLPSPG